MKRRSVLKFLALFGLVPKVAAQTVKTITHDNYCINVCGGKCCKYVLHKGKTVEARCPNLLDCNRCGIHDQWQDGACRQTLLVQIAGKGTLKIDTGTIEDAVSNHLMPKWIEDQCCYAHPELLEVKNA